jgi:hypothetical protein
MNWEAIATISELIGTIAVVATLGYVAIQIRQNTQSVATSVYESAMAGYNELNRDLTTNGDLASIARRGGNDPSSLDIDERFRFDFSVRCYANHIYKLLRLYERGALPPHEWRNIVREAAQVFSYPGFSEFKRGNHFFADLWARLEQVDPEEFQSLGWESGHLRSDVGAT